MQSSGRDSRDSTRTGRDCEAQDCGRALPDQLLVRVSAAEADRKSDAHRSQAQQASGEAKVNTKYCQSTI